MVSTKENSLLNEKHRPTTLETYVGNESLKSSIANQLARQRHTELFILWSSRNR